MEKLLIIKTGITHDVIINKYGDCDYLITSKIGIPLDSAVVLPVYENIDLYLPNDVTKIIITGSNKMVTDKAPWSVKTAKWLREIIKKDIPILGICYGHQLLAQALGGGVDYHPAGLEYGEVDIELNQDGMEDELFKVLPLNFTGYAAHFQSINLLPPNSKVLGQNNFENSHIVKFQEKVWGVQFHPEFNADIVKIHLEKAREELLKADKDVDFMIKNIKENEFGKIILQRFFNDIK